MKQSRSNRLRSPLPRGFSLVEMMVAMLVGVILLAGVVQIFLGSKLTYRTRDELATLTDNGRFAVELMQRELRMAGYSGCRTLKSVEPTVVANGPPPFNNAADGILGFDDGSGWVNPTGVTRVAGTDVISVTRASGRGIPLTSDMTDTASALQVSSQTSVISDNQLLFVSDCVGADLFRASTVTESSGTYTINHTNASNTSNLLGRAYSQDKGVIMTMSSNNYFIGVNAAGEGSLYRVAQGSGTATELVRGIQDMQILYAVDTTGDRIADDYIKASAVTDWAVVIGVNIGFLLQTEDGVTVDPQAFVFNGADANPTDDKRLRTAFWSAIALRNRVL